MYAHEFQIAELVQLVNYWKNRALEAEVDDMMDGNVEFIHDFVGFSNFSYHPVLMNFDPFYVEADDTTVFCNTSEIAFQAIKAKTFEDAKKIAAIWDPGNAKRAGRLTDLREDWQDIKFTVMKYILRAKADQHPEVKESLLATGNLPIVEANDWNDTIWGMVYDQFSNTWRGKNYLGKAWMEIRDEYRQEMS